MAGFVKKDGKIISYDGKLKYDDEAFRLNNMLYFRGIRKSGLEEERDLKQELKKIINLINQEIEK